MPTEPQDLTGTWELVEWDCTLDGRYHSHPFGKDAAGLIMYSADGYMSGILMKRGRRLFATASLAQGSADEKSEAADGYVSYAGTYEVGDGFVVHHVTFSLLPNWIGTDLKRFVSWEETPDGRHLILQTAPEYTRSGRELINRLRWRRARKPISEPVA